MRHSRVVRLGFLVLFLGVGLWCGLVLPSLFSQEGSYPKNTYIALQQPATGGGAVGNTATLPGGAPPVFLESGTAPVGAGGAAPPAGVGGPAAFGSDADAIPGLPGATIGSEAGPRGAMAPAMMGGGRGGMPAGMGAMAGGMMMGGNPYQMQEVQLARTAKTLLGRYSSEPKAEVKEQIKSQLRAVLHQQFRLQHQRRDGELARIERRLADLRSRLKKRADSQSTIVDRRLEQLVNDIDGLGWNADEIPDNLFNEGMMGPGMGSMPMMGSMGGLGMPPPGGSPAAGGPGTPGSSDSGFGSPPPGPGGFDPFNSGTPQPGTGDAGTGILPPVEPAAGDPAAVPGTKAPPPQDEAPKASIPPVESPMPPESGAVPTVPNSNEESEPVV